MTSNRNELYVSGRLEPAHTSQRISVVNPATEVVIGSIPDGDADDVDRVVSAARDAFEHSGWPQLAPSERGAYLRALADGIERRAEELSVLVSIESGIPIGASRRANGAGPAALYRYYADLADAMQVEEIRPSSGTHTIVRREPLGVAALIVPWNGPQGLIAWKLAPALVAGCTAVIKPAPETSLDAYVFAEIIDEIGLPPGVVNIVTGGREAGDLLVRHHHVDKVAFTGSTAAGRVIAAACAEQLKPVTLELGGKSAAILLDDADFAAFRPSVVQICSPNSGQVCRSCTRILAPRSRYDEAVDVVVEAMSSTPMGDPMDPATVFGPLASARQRERVEGYIRIGEEEGAKIVTGGARPAHLPVGYYVEPTVFRDVDNSMRIAREEIFGPVVVVIAYDDDEDAIRIANDSEYGLGGFVFSPNVDRAMTMARKIETGTIGVNHYAIAMDAPFGGYKQSGLGREMGPESIEAYVQTKSIYRSGAA